MQIFVIDCAIWRKTPVSLQRQKRNLRYLFYIKVFTTDYFY